jgi:hypothetical protein
LHAGLGGGEVVEVVEVACSTSTLIDSVRDTRGDPGDPGSSSTLRATEKGIASSGSHVSSCSSQWPLEQGHLVSSHWLSQGFLVSRVEEGRALSALGLQ